MFWKYASDKRFCAVNLPLAIPPAICYNQEKSEDCPGGFTHSMKTPSKGHGEERMVCFALQQLHAGSFRIGRHGAG